MDKSCRKRVDKHLNDEVKKKRSIMREALDALKEEVEKFKLKNKQIA